MSEQNGRGVVQEKLYQSQPVGEEVKMAIASEIAAGEKPIDLAEKYGCSLATVTRAKQKYLTPEMLAKMDEQKAAVLGDLMILSLESGIEATVRIANTTKDDGWLRTQNAGDLGKMYGIISDKVVRVAEAMEDIKPKTLDYTTNEEDEDRVN